MPARRRTLSALAAAAGCVVAAAVAATPATASTVPWAADTVFVAATGQRTGTDGGLFAVTADGTTTALGSGSAQDVAVADDGTVYWVACSGEVNAYSPSTGPSTVTTGLSCPTAIAV